MTQRTPQNLNIRPLAPYEDRLLNALAFFRTQRQPENQAHHCLSMYLRQSEARIMGEVGFYARLVGMEPWEFLELLYQDGDRAEALIQEATGSGVKETFES
ncbi:hypothetical protein PN466_17710 [Roseofilum reptotaenium CS-1145]|uniref:AdoMet activation domain-containing protein n=1 Tax=Roseofilum reptotaenium AO1-A TaxID=1925591 RepID=A0A1L9QVF0_9CYAN|nr:hypothetical protein [Roseofilum reptotaenium]MDB9518787.1 hypothetical protein [Roseofilum reptotaenium CS-1145]OJJ26577.1 hypothetical protein BI308_05650 [Roseofilum reptotaenium AO1-A]